MRAGSDRSVLAGLPVEFVSAELTQPGEVTHAMEAAREQLGDFRLVHNAALVSYRRRDRDRLWQCNAEAVRTLLQAARDVGGAPRGARQFRSGGGQFATRRNDR
ncbi:MAG: hypothetical protein R3E96_05770 [Planctomycetota bacterium]